MEKFCRRLPKVELHAHLNGSLSDDTLLELASLKGLKGEEIIQEYKIVRSRHFSLERCFEVFRIAQALTDTPAAVRLAASNTIEEFRKDGVVYLELRSTPRQNENMTKTEYVRAMIDAADESDSGMRTRLLISIDRRSAPRDVEDTVSCAILAFEARPDVVAGLDYSGDPSKGNFRDALPALDRARSAGLKITLHAGEIPNDDEILDMIRWKPDRLGHMTVLSDEKCPRSVTEATLRSKIPIELCLTSNIKSGTVKDYSRHQFKMLHNAEHPICLATDDKGVFDTNLSEEFLKCSETFGLDAAALWNISRSSISHIFADDAVKSDLRNVLTDFKESLKDV